MYVHIHIYAQGDNLMKNINYHSNGYKTRNKVLVLFIGLNFILCPIWVNIVYKKCLERHYVDFISN